MKKQRFDFIVIGGGSAGYAAARTAHEHGMRVAVFDGASELGGLCILRGCMPSKTLIYAAEILHHARHADRFGLNVSAANVDMVTLQARKRQIISEFADYRRGQLEDSRFTLIRKNVRFASPNEIVTPSGDTFTAGHFLIATGSVVQFPPIPGLADAPHLTSDEILDLEHCPEEVCVLGGGIVACELAQFLNRVGVKVTQIQRSTRVLKEMSPEAGTVVAKAFSDEGIQLFTGTRLESVETHADQSVSVHFMHDGQKKTVKTRNLFNALGRVPHTCGLGLDDIGVSLLPSGHIRANGFQQTSLPHIYAAGDCTGPHEIVHVAIMQGEIAARHAAGKTPAPIAFEHLTKVVFTDPQVAICGLNEQAAKEAGIDYVAADYPFDDHGKSILMEAKYGYVKVLASRPHGHIIGAECVGKDAGELIHALAVVLPLKATVFDLLRAHWYHPTLSEIWSYPIEDCADALNHNDHD